jgi:hypothetical protein
VLASRHLRALIDAAGGFTLDPTSGTGVRHGVSVCLDPHLSLSFVRSEWHDEVVNGWLVTRADVLSRRRRFLGGWLDAPSDRVWLDVVHVLPARARPFALALARRRGQRGVYDIGRRRLVSTTDVS